MYVTDDKIGKVYRGTSGFVKGLLFKIASRDEKARTCVVHTYAGDITVPSDDLIGLDADEVK